MKPTRTKKQTYELPLPSEHEEQVSFFSEVHLNTQRYPHWEFIFAIPNGGHRHVVVAAKLKAEGVKRGVPDICIPFPRGRYHGMYIEMKKKGNTTSPKQKEYLVFLESVGYVTVVCYSATEAMKMLKWYEKL